jgi:hypothetical protein
MVHIHLAKVLVSVELLEVGTCPINARRRISIRSVQLWDRRHVATWLNPESAVCTCDLDPRDLWVSEEVLSADEGVEFQPFCATDAAEERDHRSTVHSSLSPLACTSTIFQRALRADSKLPPTLTLRTLRWRTTTPTIRVSSRSSPGSALHEAPP